MSPVRSCWYSNIENMIKNAKTNQHPASNGMSNKKILLTGIQPSGAPHIGNYFGMMKQVVEMQDEYESFPFIVDYHALTTVRDKETMRQNILNVATDFLAVGLDPTKSTLFKQSDVQEHTELAWIFNCITTMPFMMRAHAFKEAQEAKKKEITLGLFTYPVLMAADILLYDTDVVPVGKDQQQHVEIARDIAEKFNQTFGETFKLPKALIKEGIAVIPGTDGKKMSKSYGNTIALFAERSEIEKAVMSIVTDSDSERPENVYAIHKLFKTEDELEKLYTENEGKYKILKEALIEDIDAFIAPLREKRVQIAEDKQYILDVLEKGAKVAKARAEAKMQEVRKKIGVIL